MKSACFIDGGEPATREPATLRPHSPSAASLKTRSALLGEASKEAGERAATQCEVITVVVMRGEEGGALLVAWARLGEG